jgi:hypothetical protein
MYFNPQRCLGGLQILASPFLARLKKVSFAPFVPRVDKDERMNGKPSAHI